MNFVDLETPRGFHWLEKDKINPDLPFQSFMSETFGEQLADLEICVFLYLKFRKKLYVNYMERGKNLFNVFFTGKHLLLGNQSPDWDEEVTFLLRSKIGQGDYWYPGYEIQRLHLHTGIHWSYLESMFAKHLFKTD